MANDLPSAGRDAATATDDPDPSTPREGVFRSLLGRIRARSQPKPEVTLRKIVEDVIEEHDESKRALSPQERLILLNLAKLRELSVFDVMVPRADIVAVADTTPLENLIELFRTAAHSRLPVYRKTLDGVIGMVHVKDVLKAQGDAKEGAPPPKIADIRRDILFVPPSVPILDLLIKMRETRIHMAAVVDEYGGIDGIATIEDVVEQVVGDIEDEHDPIEQKMLTLRQNGLIEADARVPLAEVEELLGQSLLVEARDEDIETLGGLVVSIAGRVPRRGEIIRHPGPFEFEVLDADPRRLKKLLVRRSTSPTSP